ncbi:MAG: alanyl-tRNA editing protein [Myxococcota bacterium]|nr:alanyl-tRNA editing protein [Myxococcota bacterium]
MRLLACHHDSYCTEARVVVTGCSRVEGGFRVSISESIAYPGGGGQPADRAMLGDAVVIDYVQDASAPTVLTDRAVTLGEVVMTIDWARRFDHMQQHTAQHLITATAIDLFGWETLAFHLNVDRSDIVLDTAMPPQAQLMALEEAVNQQIRSGIDVGVESMERNSLAEAGARFRRLAPGDGALRMIRIGQVDLNPCGGTHVRNTAELQAVRFVGAQVDKGKTRLFFLAGTRLIESHRTLLTQSDGMTRLLSEPARHHLDAVERLQEQLKQMAKDVAKIEGRLAEELMAQVSDADGFYSIERPVLHPHFVSTVGRLAADLNSEVVVLVHDSASGGEMNFALFGQPDHLDRIMARLDDQFTVRGGGRGTRRQGKVMNVTQSMEVAAFLKGEGARHEN